MLELLNTIAALGTFAVISATAIAAVVQLRHIRTSNQLEALLDIVARLEGETINKLISDTRRELPAMLADPAYVQSVVDRTFDRNVAWLHLANQNERIGSLLKYKLIPEDPFLDVYWPVVMQTWEIMLPMTALLRTTVWGEAIWENFEYMYVRASMFKDRYEGGNYPKDTPRADIPKLKLGEAQGAYSGESSGDLKKPAV